MLVRRRDSTYTAEKFLIKFDTVLSILNGSGQGLPAKPPWIICEDETNPEIGSDDIRIEVIVDGHHIKTITNDQIGDFDDGDSKPLHGLLPTVSFSEKVVSPDHGGRLDIARRRRHLQPHQGV